jgi:hypothetical protein
MYSVKDIAHIAQCGNKTVGNLVPIIFGRQGNRKRRMFTETQKDQVLAELVKRCGKQAGPTMTVKEVAAALGKSDRTIRRAVNASPELAKNVQVGATIRLDEAQVTAVKANLAANREVLAQPRTSLDDDAIIMAAQQILIRRLAQKDAEIKRLENDNAELAVKVGENERYKSTIEVAIITGGKELDWRPLKKYSIEHELEIKKTRTRDGTAYGYINAYDVQAWHDVYGLYL